MARLETAALRDFRFTSRRVRIFLAEGTNTACQWRALPSRSMQCTSKLRSRDCSRRTNETSPSKTISASSRRRCRAVGRRASGAGAGLSDAAHHLGGSICRGRWLGARLLSYAIHRDDIEFRVFLANLERSLKFGRIAPTLKRLHAFPPKDHDRPLRQVSRKPRSWSCRDILATVIFDRFLRRRNVFFGVALLVAELVDGDHVNWRFGLRVQSLDGSAANDCPGQH